MNTGGWECRGESAGDVNTGGWSAGDDSTGDSSTRGLNKRWEEMNLSPGNLSKGDGSSIGGSAR